MARFLAWHLLTEREDYAFERPAPLAGTLRALELLTGAERREGRRDGARVRVSSERCRLDKELAAQTEIAYRRLVADRQATEPRDGGCGRDTGARISSTISSGMRCRRTSSSSTWPWPFGVGQHGNPFGGGVERDPVPRKQARILMAMAESAQRHSIGASGPGSLSSSSMRARSSGSSRTSTAAPRRTTARPARRRPMQQPAPRSGQHAGKWSFWRRTELDTSAEITAYFRVNS
ncbi:MAG: hypothetical protein H0U06_03990 [Solirubrobacterales bacterium]|nr:hypothetical protein [Solirubrobacterales bacterium]